ncbi:MAG: hypothetical protein ABR503_13285 [Chitinophagaceae bacterium]
MQSLGDDYLFNTIIIKSDSINSKFKYLSLEENEVMSLDGSVDIIQVTNSAGDFKLQAPGLKNTNTEELFLKYLDKQIKRGFRTK